MSYKIHITPAAEEDIQRAADYIEYVLKNSEACNRFLDEVTYCINSLSKMPERFAMAEDVVLSAFGIRVMRINNYLAFFTVSEEYEMVSILRTLYEKSDWVSILKSDYIDE